MKVWWMHTHQQRYVYYTSQVVTSTSTVMAWTQCITNSGIKPRFGLCKGMGVVESRNNFSELQNKTKQNEFPCSVRNCGYN